MATAVVRACRPIIATNSDPNGCIRWSRTGAADPEETHDDLISLPQSRLWDNPCSGLLWRPRCGGVQIGVVEKGERRSGSLQALLAPHARSNWQAADLVADQQLQTFSPGRGGFGPQLALSYDSGAETAPMALSSLIQMKT